MLKKARYGVEGILVVFAMLFFRLLPLDVASALGGRIARAVGPFSRAHRTARANIGKVFPALDAQGTQRILSGMWDNLGRTIAEYPHLSRPIMAKRITVEGQENLREVTHSGKSALFVSGHFANWEIGGLASAMNGMPLVVIYRAANNPVADWMIRRIRSRFSIDMHAKGRTGAVESLKAIKQGLPLGMLVDQKQNDGQPVMFFGREAMTATAPALLAIKYGLPLLAAHTVRTDGAHFHVTLEAPLRYGPEADQIKVMEELHGLFERWIREHPAQWFWVHNRWGR